MTEQSIYLAGPIEADDSPRSWRNALRVRYPKIDWIDPMDWQDEWRESPSAVWERELQTVRSTAVLVCNIGTEAPRTTGTHHEIREALNHGQHVAIVPSGEVSQVYREVESARLFEDRDSAVNWLLEQEFALAADGGTVESGIERKRPHGDNIGRAWDRQASQNMAEWGIQHPLELLSAINEEVGEIEQAYLEATHEGEPKNRVEDEIDDLGPLLFQLVESLRNHPQAFEGLPTAEEVRSRD